jgi:hypothetical protein
VWCGPVGPPRCASRSSCSSVPPSPKGQKASVLEVSPSPEFNRSRPPCSSHRFHACGTAPLLRFSAPSALSNRSSPLAQVYLACFVPSSGFLTLSTAFSSSGLPGLVSCPCAPGVPSLQSVALGPEPSRLSTRLLPSCPPFRLHRDRPRVPRKSAVLSKQPSATHLSNWASRSCSPARVRSRSPASKLAGEASVALLGFGSPSGSSVPASRQDASTSAPPSSLTPPRRVRFGQDLCARSSDSPAPRSFHKDRIGRVLRVRDTPSWGFSTSSTFSAMGVQPSPGSSFHLGVRGLIAETSKHPLRACAAGD